MCLQIITTEIYLFILYFCPLSIQQPFEILHIIGLYLMEALYFLIISLLFVTKIISQPPFHKTSILQINENCDTLGVIDQNSLLLGCHPVDNKYLIVIKTITNGIIEKTQTITQQFQNGRIFFSNDGNLLTICNDAFVRIYVRNQNKQFSSSSGMFYDDNIQTVQISAKNSMLVLKNIFNGKIQLIPLLNGAFYQSSYLLFNYPQGFRLSDDQTLFVASFQDNKVQFYKKTQTQYTLSQQFIFYKANHFLISKDNKIVYIASSITGNVFCLKLNENNTYQEFMTTKFQQTDIVDQWSIKFSSDMKYIYNAYESTIDIYKCDQQLTKVQRIAVDYPFTWKTYPFLPVISYQITQNSVKFYTIHAFTNYFSVLNQYTSCQKIPPVSQVSKYFCKVQEAKTPLQVTLGLVVPLYAVLSGICIVLVVALVKLKNISNVSIRVQKRKNSSLTLSKDSKGIIHQAQLDSKTV